MTTAICFDLDGTLLRFEEPYDAVLSEVLHEHLGTAAEDVLTAYREAFFGAFERLEPTPVEAGMAAAAVAAGGDEDAVTTGGADGEAAAGTDSGIDTEAMAAALLDAECEATAVPEGAREALAALGVDAKLGVVTNGLVDWQTTKLAHHGLESRFDAIVASYEAGAHKPDPAPFELARERLPADEHAMVGDDYEADVEGARAAGFVPVHYEADDGPSFWTTLTAMV